MNSSEFTETDLLYREFSADELDDDGEIDVNTIRLPDLSCNWSRFSSPDDVQYREGGSRENGCYAVTVETVWYNDFATPCHDPLCQNRPNNYSHVEIRQLKEGETKASMPPKNRKKGKSRNAKLSRAEWRTNFIQNVEILIEAQ